ncbi:MAG TPA: MotA/TolQ/ExbB proton channel family protein, partial [Polyangiaceae bacterium]|nr:MotA/TolQ/ExbB proton channel family protein [Polyangiaceae bacterium]
VFADRSLEPAEERRAAAARAYQASAGARGRLVRSSVDTYPPRCVRARLRPDFSPISRVARGVLKRVEPLGGRSQTGTGASIQAQLGSLIMNTNIVERSRVLLLEIGASPILYLMIALSIVSVGIMLERALFFFRSSEDLQRLAGELAARLGRGDVGSAKQLVGASRSAEAAVVSAGLNRIPQGSAAVEEAMSAARAIQKMRLERRLGFLGTLGANAPFVGLLGTVIGIVQAFQHLEAGAASGGGTNGVMGAIAEALVATAVGLIVAIPAVVAFNSFQRRIKGILGNAEALTHIVLSYVKATGSHGENSSSGPTTHVHSQSGDSGHLERLSTVPN